MLFRSGNTSLYNQLVVRDMVSSNSLNSLLSTLVYILSLIHIYYLSVTLDGYYNDVTDKIVAFPTTLSLIHI